MLVEKNPCPAPQGFDFLSSRDAVDPQKSQGRTKGLDALGQHFLKQGLQLCKAFKLICCIICQDFYNSWKGFGEKHLFSFQNHQATLEQGEMKALKQLCIKEIRISCIKRKAGITRFLQKPLMLQKREMMSFDLNFYLDPH